MSTSNPKAGEFAGVVTKRSKAGQKVIGQYRFIDQVKTMDEFTHELKFGDFIFYNGKVYSTAFILGFTYRTIVQGLENEAFWRVERITDEGSFSTPPFYESKGEKEKIHDRFKWGLVYIIFFEFGWQVAKFLLHYN